jgi:hypothetical protein
MDFDNSPARPTPPVDAPDAPGRLPLMETIITDGKNLKKMLSFAQKSHRETSPSFYNKGMWWKSYSMDTDRTQVEIASSIRFPMSSLFKYRVNLEMLPNYNSEDPDSVFFTLTFNNTRLQDFVRNIDAKSSITMIYYYRSPNLIFMNGTTRFEIPVVFTTDSIPFPVPEELTGDDVRPVINIESDGFNTIAESLTKIKKQATYECYMDFQLDPISEETAACLHSSEKAFTDAFGPYDSVRDPDIRFTMKYHIMKALAILPKVNENGFLSFSFQDENVLRISTQVGNFATYDVYVFVKRD